MKDENKAKEQLKLINELVEMCQRITDLEKEETEHKHAEVIRESDKKFRILADLSPNIIFIKQMGKIVYAWGRGPCRI